jgi:hypothetical protein
MTIKTDTGRRWPLLDPRPELVNIEDIAHALANQCRFNGHVSSFYSVAQHAVIVSLEVFRRTKDPVTALWGLHHDDEEAYLGDMVKPLKRLREMQGFREIAAITQTAILEHFGLSWPEPDIVREVDRLMLRTEQRDLLPPWNDGSWSDGDASERGEALSHLKLIGRESEDWVGSDRLPIGHRYGLLCAAEKRGNALRWSCWQSHRGAREFIETHEYFTWLRRERA